MLSMVRISVARHENPTETARVCSVCSHLCGTLGIFHVFYVCGSHENCILDTLFRTFVKYSSLFPQMFLLVVYVRDVPYMLLILRAA